MTVYEYLRTETNPGALYNGIRDILRKMDERGRYPEDWEIKTMQRKADALYTLLTTDEPGAIWRAWKNQEITAGQLSAWQQRNNYYFNESGGQILARRLFHRLERDSFARGRYLVLNDGQFFASIYAENDADAIQRFLAGEYGRE